MPVLLDTGAIFALGDQDDAWHERVRELVAKPCDALLTPVTVLPEACYMLSAHLGQRAERAFLAACVAGAFAVVGITAEDLVRSLELLDTYADTNLGFVDASLVAVAERLGIRQLVTTDRRHFGLVRPRHCAAFELLP